ncbi:MAG: type I secretion C-terminal target domain-containing protein, partial [Burkholderiaceae bacterium]|nr:type I secretion C-terminal target domain-containing protein [Burkholderiaceae bacterium]
VGGTTYDVKVDADGKGTLTVPNANGEDVYKDASEVKAELVEVVGGNYEAVTLGDAVTAKIADTIDATKVSLETGSSDGTVTITASVNNAPTQTDLVLTLDNGEKITIEKGETSGSVSFEADPAHNTFAVTEHDGGNYEKLEYGEITTITTTPVELVADEKGLRSMEDTSETGTKSLGLGEGVTAKDGSYDLMSGETRIGVVTVTDGEVSYKLDGAKTHATGEGKNELALGVAEIGVTDANGNTGTVTVNVNVIDDVPSIEYAASAGEAADVDSITGLASGAAASGIIDVKGGADGASSVTIGSDPANLLDLDNGASKAYTGAAGILTVTMNDGVLSYSYEAKTNANLSEDLSDSFEVKVTDADGDTATDTLTVSVAPVEISADPLSLSVDESALDSSAQAPTYDDVAVYGNGATSITDKSGHIWNFDESRSYEVKDSTGKVIGTAVTDADGKLTVTLTDNTTTHSAGDANDAVSAQPISVSVTDADGNTGTVQLNVMVYDDGLRLSSHSQGAFEAIPGDAIKGTLTANFSGLMQGLLNEDGNVTSSAASRYHNELVPVDSNGILSIGELKVSTAKVYFKEISDVTDALITGVESKADQYSDKVLGNAYVDFDDKSGKLTFFAEQTADNRWGVGIRTGDSDSAEAGYHKEETTSGSRGQPTTTPAYSEAFVIDLDGKAANTININFHSFYHDASGNFFNPERAYEKLSVAFYYKGKLVAVENWEGRGDYGTENGGELSQHHNLSDVGSFDKVVIFATDDGHSSDPSDFLIDSIEVGYSMSQIDYAVQGTLFADGVGADGLVENSLQITGVQALEDSGFTVNLGEDGSWLKAYSDNKLAFQLDLEESGEWVFSQYQKLEAGLDLSVEISGTDGDGDVDSIALSPIYMDTAGVIQGGIYDDVIHGSSEGDTIRGGLGNDIIVGAAGDNIMFGDAGNDTFRFTEDSLLGKTKGDTITDFEVGKDVLDLSELLSGATDNPLALENGGALSLTVKEEGGKAVITIGIDQDGNGADAPTLAVVHTDLPYQGEGGASGMEPATLLQNLLNDQSSQTNPMGG